MLTSDCRLFNNVNMTAKQQIDVNCPYCAATMRCAEMSCDACETSVRGEFVSTPLANMPLEHQRFIEMFVLASGNLKEIATLAGVSYPTVRSRLDKVIASLRDVAEQHADQTKGAGKQSSKKKANDLMSRSRIAADIIKRI